MRRFWSIIFMWFCIFWATNAQADSFRPDSILLAGINKTIETYQEVLTLTDITGFRNPAYEERLRNLIADHGTIFNFLPETSSYRQEIPVEDFIETAANYIQEHIIQHEFSPFEIVEIKKTDTDGLLLIHVLLEGMLIVFPRDFSSSIRTRLSLNLFIKADQDKGDFLISRVQRNDPGILTLGFRVLFVDMAAASWLPLEVSYVDPESGDLVSRSRNTDGNGRFEISMIPPDALLEITPPAGYSLLINEPLTGNQWDEVPVSERRLYLKKDPLFADMGKRSHVYVGAARGYSTAGLGFANTVFDNNHGADFSFANFQHEVDFDPQTDIYLHYAFRLMTINRMSLLLGSGVAFVSGKISFMADSVQQTLVNQHDLDNDIFNLHVFASGVHEQYTYEEFRIPVFATLSIPIGQKGAFFADISAKVAYAVAQQANYSTSATNLMSTGYYPAYDVMLTPLPGHEPYTRDYHFKVFDGVEYVSDKDMINYHRLTYGLQLAFRMALYGRSLFLLPAITGQFTQFGHNKETRYNKKLVDNGYHYLQVLDYGQLIRGGVGFGVSLLMVF